MHATLLNLAAMASTALAATGSFNVLTMNVAGLPAILNNNDVPGDKATNAGTIGTKFAQLNYDIIHVQEDFNYHAYIYATDTHPQRTATSGGVPFGSGLNTLAKFPWTTFNRITWKKCDIGSGDCLTPKGFTMMRMTVASGVEVDLYNLHADAGSEPGDEAARTANLQQVGDYIAANSAGRAVLVFGDTNSRWTRAGDNLASFAAGTGLVDTWVELVRGGVVPTAETVCSNPSTTNNCETVDKVFYRSGSSVKLRASKWNYESSKFLQANGDILSDHNPVTVTFTYST